MTYFFKKIYILRLCYPDILLYIILYPVCKFFLHRTKKCDQKDIKIDTRRDICHGRSNIVRFTSLG